MTYPTNVVEPRLGYAAFDDNDPASQLAQAAYLLLLGRQLTGDMPVTRLGDPERRPYGPDEDTSRFNIPPIPYDGQRFRYESFPVHPLPPGASTSDAFLRDVTRELARRLQQHPDAATAASLLQVCALRPEPIVSVAAAASAFGIVADPTHLLHILAKGTTSDDELVRDVAATALARIDPRHEAILRLERASGRGATPAETRTSLLVHGTWARTQSWWQPGGSFHSYLLPQVLPDLYAASDRFDWSGGYSDAARALAASDLRQWLSSHAAVNPLVMGHSHGANVVLLATQLGVSMREAVLLSCPVHWPKYTPNFPIVPNVVSIRVHMDLVILADGGGQRFTHPQIRENVLPVWFNHSATHDPAIWQQYGVPGML